MNTLRLHKRTGADVEVYDCFSSIEDQKLIILVPDEDGGHELQLDLEQVRELVVPRDNVLSFAAALKTRRRGA